MKGTNGFAGVERVVRDDVLAAAPGSAFTWWGHPARRCFTLTRLQGSKPKVRSCRNIRAVGSRFFRLLRGNSGIEKCTLHAALQGHEQYEGFARYARFFAVRMQSESYAVAPVSDSETPERFTRPRPNQRDIGSLIR